MSKHYLNICLGDKYADGHGLYETFHLESNHSAKEIEEAYKKTVDKFIVDITKECTDFEDDTISEDMVKFISKYFPTILESCERDQGMVEITPDIFIRIYFSMASMFLPDLIWKERDLNEERISGLEVAGYGLFMP